MSVSPYAVTTEAFKKHGQEVNPHPQYALAADVAKQLSAKAHVSHTHPSSPIIVAASPGAVTVHIHAIGDVTGLQAALNSKAAVSHGHSISDVTSLQDALDAKAAISHGHPQSDVTNLVSDLAGKAAVSHTHTLADITGDGALAAKNTIATGDIDNDAVTYAKLQNVTDARLLGRSAGSAGDAQEITVGSGLSLSGGALTATGGASDGPILARIPTADVTNNSNVNFVNLFTRAILAGEVWSFEGIIYWFSAAGTTGLVAQVDAPTSPTFSQCLLATGESATAWRTLAAAAGAPMVGTASAVAVIIAAYVSGTIENGANAGNIVIKFRSEVNASLVTVKRGSWCRFYKH